MSITGVLRTVLVATFLVVLLATIACAPEDGPATGEPTATSPKAAVEPATGPVTEPVTGPAAETKPDSVSEHLGENPLAVALDQMKEIMKALEFHNLDTGEYPESLDALTESTADDPMGYITSIPLDPWGMSYIYRFDGRAYELASAGPDGKEGTEDDVTLPGR